MNPLVSVIICNYNGRAHLEACLPSLAGLTYPADRLEILVVDNGSADGSADYVRERFPGVRVIAEPANRGFAGGNNIGARAARGELCAFLNNDTRVDPGWLTAAVGTMERENAASVASLMLDWDGRTIDFAGGEVSLVGHAWQVQHGSPAVDRPRSSRPLLFACGGAMLIRREVFLDAGGFDEDYFAYFEDVDLGWRLNILGHRVVLAPESLVYHRQRGTAAALSMVQRLVLYERNALCSVFKNAGGETMPNLLAAALLAAARRAWHYAGLDEGAFAPMAAGLPDTLRVPKMAMAHLIGIDEFGRVLPAMAPKRAVIQAQRRRSDDELAELFTPLRRHEFGAEYERAFETILRFWIPPSGGGKRPAVGSPNTGLRTQDSGLRTHSGTATPSSALSPQSSVLSPDVAPGTRHPAPDHRDSELRTQDSGLTAGQRHRPQPSVLSPAADALPSVSIIVLTHNGRAHLEACLSSLLAADYPAAQREILLVDNASTDGSAAFVASRFPEVRVLRQERNLGFAGGNNAGARVARGEWLVFQNDDTRVDSAWLRELVSAAQARGAAAVSALVLNWDGSRIDFAGSASNFHGFGWQLGYGEPVAAAPSEPRRLPFPNGGSMLINRRVFLDADGFDERYFAFYEDIDLGWRLGLRGHQIWLAPAARCFHKHHGTASRLLPAQRTVLYERNALASVVKNYGPAHAGAALSAAVLLSVRRALGKAGLTRDHDIRWKDRGAVVRLFGFVLDSIYASLYRSGVRRKASLKENLHALGVLGWLRAAWAGLRVLRPRDGHGWSVGSSTYDLALKARGLEFDRAPETVPAHAAAHLVALKQLADWLPELAAASAGPRAVRDRDVLALNGEYLRQAAPAAEQEAYDRYQASALAALGLNQWLP